MTFSFHVLPCSHTHHGFPGSNRFHVPIPSLRHHLLRSTLPRSISRHSSTFSLAHHSVPPSNHVATPGRQTPQAQRSSLSQNEQQVICTPYQAALERVPPSALSQLRSSSLHTSTPSSTAAHPSALQAAAQPSLPLASATPAFFPPWTTARVALGALPPTEAAASREHDTPSLPLSTQIEAERYFLAEVA